MSSELEPVERRRRRERRARLEAEAVGERTIRELYKALVELRRFQETVEAIGALPGLYLRISATGAVTHAYGSSDPELEQNVVGARLPTLLPPPAADEAERALEHARETGEVASFEYERPQGDDGRHYEASVARLDGGVLSAVVRDVTASRRAEADLRATTVRLATLISSLNAGVLVEDEQRRIALTNAQFCRFFGILAPPEALVGADCADAAEQSKALAADPDAFVARIHDILRAGAVVRGEEVEFADGRVFERDYVPIEVDGVLQGRLWVYRDLTDRKDVERQLEHERHEAVAASHAKSEFLAMMSHEIRTPMQGVLGTLDLLAVSDLEDEQRALVEIAERSATALLDLINDILDVQKIELGGLDLASEPLDLGVVIRGVVETLSPSAQAKGLVVTTAVDPAIPSRLEGDPGRLRQVLLNIVGNAVKFTDEGGIAIEARLAEPGDAEVMIRVTVADTGIGIPDEQQSQIFDPFVQVDSSSSRAHGGSGLGLAIVAQLVRLMGGTIGLESEQGGGTRVTFTAKLRPSSVETLPDPDRRHVEQLASGSVVLLADDDDVGRVVALQQLERLGVEADAVNTGRGALEAIARRPYDLVLMDYRMPELDGLQATEAIRRREQDGGRRVPIVAMTASALPGDRQAFRRAGADAYLTKPLTLASLRDVLVKWLPAGGETTAAAPSGDEIEHALEGIAEDLGRPGAVGVAAMWLERLPQRLAAITAAAAAGDLAALAESAHALKSASSLLAASAVTGTAGELELLARGHTASDAASVDALVGALDAAARNAAEHVDAWRRTHAG